jgi:hypothetical protein
MGTASSAVCWALGAVIATVIEAHSAIKTRRMREGVTASQARLSDKIATVLGGASTERAER